MESLCTLSNWSTDPSNHATLNPKVLASTKPSIPTCSQAIYYPDGPQLTFLSEHAHNWKLNFQLIMHETNCFWHTLLNLTVAYALRIQGNLSSEHSSKPETLKQCIENSCKAYQ